MKFEHKHFSSHLLLIQELHEPGRSEVHFEGLVT